MTNTNELWITDERVMKCIAMSMQKGLRVREDGVDRHYGGGVKGIVELLKYNKMWYLLVDKDILPGK